MLYRRKVMAMVDAYDGLLPHDAARDGDDEDGPVDEADVADGGQQHSTGRRPRGDTFAPLPGSCRKSATLRYGQAQR